MRFCDIFDSYIDARLGADGEVMRAVEQFKRNIPGRVLQMEFDGSHSNKQGVKNGDTVYKLGLDLNSAAAFIEYFENCNQGQPTMSIRVERLTPAVIIGGRQVDKTLSVRFSIAGGRVDKAVNIG